MTSHRNVGEIATGFRPSFVDHTKIPVQEDASISGIQQDSQRGRLRIGDCVQAGNILWLSVQVGCNAPYLGEIDRDYGVAAAIGARSAIDFLLHFGSEDLKGSHGAMVGRKVTSESEILFRLRGSEPKDFSQIRDHD